ncbi:hypothetical protein Ae406Ps2_3196 [Pseudonocardia sp. Ae406_Ps2]|nr:hypothetical protein Ae331Ps2_2730c [Pseudonocardia sp. Ae331_Ps2]OLM03196.1 hypothetical protein Ae406Ps2_3196 [Pseudonocardia sp. Ae406_Ps2]OLM11927.1 hypothetical protein Ae505Ps2_2053c [Pseudonocardia sp. Ae505_Ps2]OLM24755.1 hypothetical protein Ae706Ps2_3188 [Pseudonocardia sp. Ae706_Ps2]
MQHHVGVQAQLGGQRVPRAHREPPGVLGRRGDRHDLAGLTQRPADLATDDRGNLDHVEHVARRQHDLRARPRHERPTVVGVLASGRSQLRAVDGSVAVPPGHGGHFLPLVRQPLRCRSPVKYNTRMRAPGTTSRGVRDEGAQRRDERGTPTAQRHDHR